MMACPLCRSDQITTVEVINAQAVISSYKKMTNIDFSYLIREDITYCRCQVCDLNFYSPLVTGDERFYNAMQEFDWYYVDEKSEYDFAKEMVKPGDKVLEVGSGKGAFAKHIGPHDYTGLDFSPKAKALAAQNGVHIENKSIEEYAKSNPGKFDVVVSFQVLEHVANPKAFLEAKILALKKGGRLIIAVPNDGSFLKYAKNNILNMPPHHVTRWSSETFSYLEKKYTLRAERIHCEMVQEIHRQFYLTSFISSLFFAHSMFPLSVFEKICRKLINVFSRFFAKNIKEEFLPHGHTLVAVFEKL